VEKSGTGADFRPLEIIPLALEKSRYVAIDDRDPDGIVAIDSGNQVRACADTHTHTPSSALYSTHV
jgi:hypothetical protein